MSILIRGMEMPTSCYDCCFCRTYDEPNQGYFCIPLFADLHRTDFTKKRIDACPLIEVPKHGRLIDADALKETMKIITRTEVQEIVEFDRNAYKVDDAPTIIPAEEGE